MLYKKLVILTELEVAGAMFGELAIILKLPADTIRRLVKVVTPRAVFWAL